MWNRDDIKVDLVFIRHGRTKQNINKKYAGSYDESLAPEGAFEIRENIARGNYPEADMIFVSPMLRCVETKRLIYGYREAVAIDEFKEIDFGFWEGLGYNDLKDDADYQAWVESKGVTKIPGGESQEEFCNRVTRGFKYMMDCIYRYAKDNELKYVKVAIIAHGGTIMAVGKSIFGMDFYAGNVVKNGECKVWSIT